MYFETLKLVYYVIFNLKEGLSVSRSIELASNQQNTEIFIFFRNFILNYKNGNKDYKTLLNQLTQVEHQILSSIFIMGLEGYPIQQTLESFQEELSTINKSSVEKYQQILPFKMLIPLMIFYFPAVFILFVGPFISEFIKTFE